MPLYMPVVNKSCQSPVAGDYVPLARGDNRGRRFLSRRGAQGARISMGQLR